MDGQPEDVHGPEESLQLHVIEGEEDKPLNGHDEVTEFDIDYNSHAQDIFQQRGGCTILTSKQRRISIILIAGKKFQNTIYVGIWIQEPDDDAQATLSKGRQLITDE